MRSADDAGQSSAAPQDSAAAVVPASREARLYITLTGLFITNALIAEFVGVKIFALEDTLGVPPLDWRLFGQSGSLSFTAGVMLWPIVFIMTDVINEHFGVRGVRLDFLARRRLHRLCLPIRLRRNRARACEVVGHGGQ